VELERHLPIVLGNRSFTVGAISKIGSINIDRVAKAGLAWLVSRAIWGAIHLFRLVDPRVRPFGAGDSGGLIVLAPEDERLAVSQARPQVDAERFPAARGGGLRGAAVGRPRC